MKAQRRHYDHRFRQLVHDTGDIQLAVRRGVPRSTASGWAHRSATDVVTTDDASGSDSELRKEVITLRAKNAKLVAMLRLTFVLLRVYDVTLLRRRLADGPDLTSQTRDVILGMLRGVLGSGARDDNATT